MDVRLRFLRVCTIVVAVLGWTITAAAAGVLEDRTEVQGLVGPGTDNGRFLNTADGPPANLDTGVFLRVVNSMWRESLTFRRQCQRLGAERGLVVKLLSHPSHRGSSVRASTEMSRKNGTLTLARVVIFSPRDAVELIAHEIEHVIEQLDGVEFLDRASTRTTREAGAAYETGRAVEIGRVVAREIRAARGRVVMNLPQREQPGDSLAPASASVSADGRFIAFTSAARLVAADEDDDVDLFVLDLQTRRTTLESSRPGWASRYRPILYPRISGSGRFIYLRDTARNMTSRVSRGSNGKNANGPSSWPALSGDGRVVAFVSDATNMVRGDGNGRADIFLHDTSTGATELVSRRPDGKFANGASGLPAISRDGQTLAFQSFASDLVCLKDCSPTEQDINLLLDVFVYNRSSGVMIRASLAEAQEWMAASHAPALDGSGQVLVFASRHPIGIDDAVHDDDLFVWVKGPGQWNR